MHSWGHELTKSRGIGNSTTCNSARMHCRKVSHVYLIFLGECFVPVDSENANHRREIQACIPLFSKGIIYHTHLWIIESSHKTIKGATFHLQAFFLLHQNVISFPPSPPFFRRAWTQLLCNKIAGNTQEQYFANHKHHISDPKMSESSSQVPKSSDNGSLPGFHCTRCSGVLIGVICTHCTPKGLRPAIVVPARENTQERAPATIPVWQEETKAVETVGVSAPPSPPSSYLQGSASSGLNSPTSGPIPQNSVPKPDRCKYPITHKKDWAARDVTSSGRIGWIASWLLLLSSFGNWLRSSEVFCDRFLALAPKLGWKLSTFSFWLYWFLMVVAYCRDGWLYWVIVACSWWSVVVHVSLCTGFWL